MKRLVSPQIKVFLEAASHYRDTTRIYSRSRMAQVIPGSLEQEIIDTVLADFLAHMAKRLDVDFEMTAADFKDADAIADKLATLSGAGFRNFRPPKKPGQ